MHCRDAPDLKPRGYWLYVFATAGSPRSGWALFEGNGVGIPDISFGRCSIVVRSVRCSFSSDVTRERNRISPLAARGLLEYSILVELLGRRSGAHTAHTIRYREHQVSALNILATLEARSTPYIIGAACPYRIVAPTEIPTDRIGRSARLQHLSLRKGQLTARVWVDDALPILTGDATRARQLANPAPSDRSVANLSIVQLGSTGGLDYYVDGAGRKRLRLVHLVNFGARMMYQAR